MGEEKKKRYQVNFRLNEDEAAEVEAMAKKVGMSISRYAKRQTLNGKIVTSGITREEVREILGALGSWGNNLNQIAKAANQGGGVNIPELKAINKALDDVWTYIRTGKKQRKPATPKAQDIEPQTKQSTEAPKCSGCGAEMVKRRKKGTNEQFWGCPNWADKTVKHSFIPIEEG